MTPTLTAEQIGELEALLAMASPAPVMFLENQSIRGHNSVVFPDGDAEIGTWWVAGFEHKEDGRLFAALRNAAPALVSLAKAFIDHDSPAWDANERLNATVEELIERAEKAEAEAKRCVELEGRLKNSMSGELIMFERAEKAESRVQELEQACRHSSDWATCAIEDMKKAEAEVSALRARLQSTESAMGRAMELGSEWRKEAAELRAQMLVDQVANPSFQDRVKPWMMTCFGAEISADKVERGDRVLEEVFELLQAVGYDPARVLALRDYVWGRPIGDPPQETGGVMVTLAAFCLAHDLDMYQAGETELARINQPEIILKIRAKQAAKPTGSALPIAMPPAETPRTCQTCADESTDLFADPCADCGWPDLPNWTPKPIPSTTDKGEKP